MHPVESSIPASASPASDLDRDGFCYWPKQANPNHVDAIARTIEGETAGHAYGRRNLLKNEHLLSALRACGPLTEAIAWHAPGAFAVRAIYFDKPFRANWSVPWHQDLTIAVDRRSDARGFSAWTVKSGVHHAQPPVHILESILTARIHLDQADESNGALLVCPASHGRGRIQANYIPGVLASRPTVRCDASPGDILLMRPLLLHSSRSSETGKSRRVLHIEFCAAELPGSMQWYERIHLT